MAANDGTIAGGEGGFRDDAPLSKADMVLIRTAVKQRYNITDEMRETVLGKTMEAVESAELVRDAVAAIKTFAMLDKMNMDQEKIDSPQVKRIEHTHEHVILTVEQRRNRILEALGEDSRRIGVSGD